LLPPPRIYSRIQTPESNNHIPTPRAPSLVQHAPPPRIIPIAPYEVENPSALPQSPSSISSNIININDNSPAPLLVQASSQSPAPRQQRNFQPTQGDPSNTLGGRRHSLTKRRKNKKKSRKYR
jgi:hypothetical protein